MPPSAVVVILPFCNQGQHADKPTSAKNYGLEGLDPKHRSWGHMDAQIFDDWLNSPSDEELLGLARRDPFTAKIILLSRSAAQAESSTRIPTESVNSTIPPSWQEGAYSQQENGS